LKHELQMLVEPAQLRQPEAQRLHEVLKEEGAYPSAHARQVILSALYLTQYGMFSVITICPMAEAKRRIQQIPKRVECLISRSLFLKSIIIEYL
jgi:hypothetical protein